MKDHQITEERPDGWQACPKGLLSDLRGRLRWKSRRAQLARTASVFTIVLCVGATWWLSQQPTAVGNHHAACVECRDSVHSYLANTLPAASRASIDFHLERCRTCREFYQQQGAWSAATQPDFPTNDKRVATWEHSRLPSLSLAITDR